MDDTQSKRPAGDPAQAAASPRKRRKTGKARFGPANGGRDCSD